MILIRLKPVGEGSDSYWPDEGATLPEGLPAEGAAVLVTSITSDQAASCTLSMSWVDAAGNQVAGAGRAMLAIADVLTPPGSSSTICELGPAAQVRSGESYPLFDMRPGRVSVHIGTMRPPAGATHCRVLLWGWEEPS